MKSFSDISKDQSEGRYKHPEVIGSRVPVYGYAHSITRMVLENSYGELLKDPEHSPIPDIMEPVEQPQVTITNNVIHLAERVVQRSEVDEIRDKVEASYGLSEAA